MKVDALLLVSDAQAFAATGVSTNSIDTRSPATQNLEIGTGETIGFGFTVDVAADATTGDETYQAEIVSDDVNTLGSPTLVVAYPIARARLVAGSAWFLALPPREPQEQFLGMRWTLGGTTPSITVTAFLITQREFAETYKAYAKGYTIS